MGIIRRLLGSRSGGALPAWDAEAAADATAGVGIDFSEGLDYDDVMANLEYKRMEIEQVKDVVIREIKETYDSIVKAVKEGDRETAELLAAEVALKKNIVKALGLVSKLLKLAIARIRTAKTTEEAVKALGPVVAVLRSMSPYLTNMSPELAVQIAAIRDEIERLYSVPGMSVESINARGILDLVPEARNVLKEAVKEVNAEVEKVFPEPTAIDHARDATRFDLDRVGARLIEYIRMNNGRINVRKASEALGVPPSVVKAALKRLEERGIIRLAPRRREESGLPA